MDRSRCSATAGTALISTQLFEISLLIPQLVETSLLLEQTLSLLHEVLTSLQFLPIAFAPLLLLLLPVPLTPVVVAIIIGAIPAISIALPLLAPLLPT